MRVCNKPGCPTLYEGTEGRGPEHRRQARANRVDNRVYSSKGHRAFLTVLPSGRNPSTGKSKWWLQAPTTDNGSSWFRNVGGGDSDAGLLVFDITPDGFDLSSLTVL